MSDTIKFEPNAKTVHGASLYGKTDPAKNEAYPILVEEGAMLVRNVTADIKWDKILPAPTATTDVYVFSFDGVTTATITINYTDETKETVSPVTGITKVLA